MKEKPTQAELKEVFRYDKYTGKLYRESSRFKAVVGREVGSKSKGGYLNVLFKGRTYPVARIIWCLVTGYWPEHVIDHINRNPSDNRWENLRHVTTSCNNLNRGSARNCISGIKGVRRQSAASYSAFITPVGSGKQVYLGAGGLIEACCLRLAAEQCLGWYRCDMPSPAAIAVSRYVRAVTKEGMAPESAEIMITDKDREEKLTENAGLAKYTFRGAAYHERLRKIYLAAKEEKALKKLTERYLNQPKEEQP